MSNYAWRAREVLASQLAATGRSVPDDLLDLYALLVFTTRALTTLADVHDAWSIWTLRHRPEHRSLVPFAALAPEVQALDEPYRAAIAAAAAHLEGDPA